MVKRRRNKTNSSTKKSIQKETEKRPSTFAKSDKSKRENQAESNDCNSDGKRPKLDLPLLTSVKNGENKYVPPFTASRRADNCLRKTQVAECEELQKTFSQQNDLKCVQIEAMTENNEGIDGGKVNVVETIFHRSQNHVVTDVKTTKRELMEMKELFEELILAEIGNKDIQGEEIMNNSQLISYENVVEMKELGDKMASTYPNDEGSEENKVKDGDDGIVNMKSSSKEVNIFTCNDNKVSPSHIESGRKSPRFRQELCESNHNENELPKLSTTVKKLLSDVVSIVVRHEENIHRDVKTLEIEKDLECIKKKNEGLAEDTSVIIGIHPNEETEKLENEKDTPILVTKSEQTWSLKSMIQDDCKILTLQDQEVPIIFTSHKTSQISEESQKQEIGKTSDVSLLSDLMNDSQYLAKEFQELEELLPNDDLGLFDDVILKQFNSTRLDNELPSGDSSVEFVINELSSLHSMILNYERAVEGIKRQNIMKT